MRALDLACLVIMSVANARKDGLQTRRVEMENLTHGLIFSSSLTGDTQLMLVY
jgi:hypothetical protein